MSISDSDRQQPESDPTDLEMLQTFLAGRDVECPQCHYNLRDLAGDRCPECGDQLVLRVNLAEPKLGAMIAGLVGLSSGAGFSGLLLVYIGIQMMLRPGWNGGEIWRFIGLTAAGLLIEGSLAVRWVTRWRKIRKYSASTRKWLVAGCSLLTLLNILIFSLRIR